MTIANIIPVTKARGKLGNIADKVSGEDYVILTKGGSPRAAIVDINYLAKLQNAVNSLYQKTFIDPKLAKYTRSFSDKEVDKWLEDDKL